MKPCLSSNQLKVIAMVTMTIDHLGIYLLPQYGWMHMVGRLSMPIYAYLIAQGCIYTHSKNRYLLRLLTLGLACQTVYYFASGGSLYQNILLTFSLSIAMIASLDHANQTRTVRHAVVAIGVVLISMFLCIELPRILVGTDYEIDYGFLGSLLPVCTYFGGTPGFLLGLILLCLDCGGIQWYALAALPIVLLYNGKRGKLRMGLFFYLYYPLHLVFLFLLKNLIYALGFL